MTGNCGLPDGVDHQHAERCYRAGLVDGRAEHEAGEQPPPVPTGSGLVASPATTAGQPVPGRAEQSAVDIGEIEHPAAGVRKPVSAETAQQRTETETEFLRDGEWVPYVLIRRDEIGAVECRHRVVTVTTHRGEWRQGRASGTIPGPATLPIHLGRKDDPIFTECDIDRANARRWTWDRNDTTCKKCLSASANRTPPVTPAPPCRQCGPGYRIGDDGCRHTEGGSDV